MAYLTPIVRTTPKLRQRRVILVATGSFAQTYIFKVCVRNFQAAGWLVGTVRVENCWGKTCMHSTDFGGWGRQPEQCLEFPKSDPHQTQLRRALQEARLRKADHVIVFADRYEEGSWRIWWQARLFAWRGIKVCAVQVGERYNRKALEYLAGATGGEYRRLYHDKYIENEVPALMEFAAS